MSRQKQFKVVITDLAWSDLSIETDLFAPLNIELIAAQCKTKDDIIKISETADAIIAIHSPITKEVINALDQCKLIAVSGEGYNSIDIQAATDAGIIVTNCAGYCCDEVADHTMALMLSCARGLFLFDRRIKDGIWDYQSAGKLQRLKNMTLGLVGFGGTARAVAQKAKPFQMTIMASDPFAPAAPYQALGVENADLVTLLQASDYVSIHTPLTPATRNLISSNELQLMKSSAFIINTSRGGILDEKALYEALTKGVIRGAALDVLEKEPPDYRHPLFSLDNILVTPHAAFYSENSIKDVRLRTGNAVVSVYHGGLPDEIVNKDVLKNGRLKMYSRRQKRS
jgi:D-3-phosphoglycerate dehydrogenase